MYVTLHSSMDLDDDECEIIRYTLYGYIGTRLSDMDMKIRQKRAYNKLSFLNDVQFGNLVKDVKLEINKRVLGMKIPEIENKKLAALNDVKFKDLVTDVFLMFNKRMPSKIYGDTDEPEILLFNFESLINSLKNENNVLMKKIKGADTFFEKMKYYQQFVESLVQKNIEPNHIEEHMTFIKEINTVLDRKETILLNILENNQIIQKVSEDLLKDNPYFLRIRDKIYNLEEEHDQNERNKTILDVLELILFKNSYNYEIEETIELLSSCHSSHRDLRSNLKADEPYIVQKTPSTHDMDGKDFDSVFQQKLYKLIEGIKIHAERINDTEKIQILDKFLDNSIEIRKEDKILQLAHILKEIIIKDRNCHVKNEIK